MAICRFVVKDPFSLSHIRQSALRGVNVSVELELYACSA